MAFYFVVFLSFGLIAGSAHKMIKLGENPALVPAWSSGTYGTISRFFAMITYILGILTTLVQWGFMWAIVSGLEVGLGAYIALHLKNELNFLMVLIAPFVSILFLGAMWGFWYI